MVLLLFIYKLLNFIDASQHTEAEGGKALIRSWQFLKPNYYCLCFCSNALNIQIFIKMNRSDYAERQLRVMQQVDEDHTLTQLAMAWFNLAVVCKHSFLSVLIST